MSPGLLSTATELTATLVLSMIKGFLSPATVNQILVPLLAARLLSKVTELGLTTTVRLLTRVWTQVGMTTKLVKMTTRTKMMMMTMVKKMTTRMMMTTTKRRKTTLMATDH